MTNKPKCNPKDCQYYTPEGKTFGLCFLHIFEDDTMGFRQLDQECDIEEVLQYPEVNL